MTLHYPLHFKDVVLKPFALVSLQSDCVISHAVRSHLFPAGIQFRCARRADINCGILALLARNQER